ncbi:MAG: XcyI family restriction endonuclease [Okeania sp. SIO2F4]|uniref:XcyI family restriction endonuclease n=1 Tax=Okeania sp. SIO2F4 TaxID=2607790 RepID=UPI00142C98E6|nr:XcyI family restriction endonuclease [Okeania sp. SIO2F4]NES05399.1 XcyI family restriction endonuclease [Okeania sp. SIO2F4]
MVNQDKRQAWMLDQLAKSELFHQKLHEWGMLEIADKIEEVKGERLEWNLQNLGISQTAWNKVIHRGIKPVIVFAHPQVLINILCSVSYYRMLAMVSQKSMSQVGLSIIRYEQGSNLTDELIAIEISQHLNKIISYLVEADEQIDSREFNIWRGMAAGAQAQGSWQNIKGNKIEIIIRGLLERRLNERRLVTNENLDASTINLLDGRVIIFADEPDIGIYKDEKIIAAVEIKGGIDQAGILERVGAAIKSLSRAKTINSESITVLILQGVSITQQAINDLNNHQLIVNHWFTVEEVLENNQKQKQLFAILDI